MKERFEAIMKWFDDFYDDHEAAGTLVLITVFTAVTYIVLTPFMILWKALGLYDKAN